MKFFQVALSRLVLSFWFGVVCGAGLSGAGLSDAGVGLSDASAGLSCASAGLICASAGEQDQEMVVERQPDVANRVPWTASRFFGTPEPPLPLEIEPAFPQLFFSDPMQVRWQPDVQRYFLCELSGKIWSFPHDPQLTEADLVVDLHRELRSFDPQKSHGVQQVYSLVFDPDFATNRFVYVCLIFSNATDSPLNDGSRISRFTVEATEPPRIDVATELPIITWLLGGHNGCDLAFDQTGCLLISTGDAADPSPPDQLQVGQNLNNLLASVLRIDVRGATREQPYRIPSDNPFVDRDDARPEVWAYGFRNPWRMATDPSTGAIWLGDVGWEKWEMIHQVVAGGNYGWSVREGFELIQPQAKLGPTPILPPRVVLSHSESASITGGFVYRGRSLAEVSNHYLFGDWVNGRVWAVPADGPGDEYEVASGPLRIIAFAPDCDGEPLILNHFSPTTLFRLVRNPQKTVDAETTSAFPTRLSQTGLFLDTPQQIVQPGVRSFQINQPMWHDGAVSQHFLALPDLSQVAVFDQPQPLESIAMFNGRMHYPSGAVLAKTLSLHDQPIETQVLHFDGRLWRGYSYVWNQERTDADLAPATGLELELPFGDGRKWTIHGRSECLHCHNPWAEHTLAFTPEQLHRPRAGDDSPWVQIVEQGYVRTQNAERQPVPPANCVRGTLSQTEEDLALRARSYLHVNCAHCHQFGAGTGVALSLKISDSLDAMNCLNVMPEKGQFEIPDSRLIRPQDPLRSVLLFRMASLTTGRMPHIGSREVDFAGVQLIAKWIGQLPDDSESGARSAASPTRTELSEVEQAFSLALKLADRRVAGVVESPHQRNELRDRIAQQSPVVGSLLEPFLPVSERIRRLGSQATFAEISDLIGNPETGRSLFLDSSRLQCAACHHVEGVNADAPTGVGPDLSQIGNRVNRHQLFEAIADPSRQIEPRYQGHSILRVDGTVVFGIVDDENADSVTLRTANGERIVIPIAEIDGRQISTQSLMPSGLAQQLTAQEMADLLAFLLTLRSDSDSQNE